MNILVYLAAGFYGLGLVIQGYKELRDQRYETYFRSNIFRRAKLVVFEGKRIVPLAMWHMLAGVLLFTTSLYMILQNHPNALSFVIIWVIVYAIIETTVGTISIGSLTRHYQQTGAEASDVEQSLQE